MVSNLVKKLGVDISLAGLVFGSFGCAGGELYFPAGKDPNLKSRLERYVELEKQTASHNESVYLGLPLLVHEFEILD